MPAAKECSATVPIRRQVSWSAGIYGMHTRLRCISGSSRPQHIYVSIPDCRTVHTRWLDDLHFTQYRSSCAQHVPQPPKRIRSCWHQRPRTRSDGRPARAAQGGTWLCDRSTLDYPEKFHPRSLLQSGTPLPYILSAAPFAAEGCQNTSSPARTNHVCSTASRDPAACVVLNTLACKAWRF